MRGIDWAIVDSTLRAPSAVPPNMNHSDPGSRDSSWSIPVRTNARSAANDAAAAPIWAMRSGPGAGEDFVAGAVAVRATMVRI